MQNFIFQQYFSKIKKLATPFKNPVYVPDAHYLNIIKINFIKILKAIKF